MTVSTRHRVAGLKPGGRKARIAALLAAAALAALSGCQNTPRFLGGKPASPPASQNPRIVTPLPGRTAPAPAPLPPPSGPSEPAPQIAVPPVEAPAPLVLKPPAEEEGKVRVGLLLPLSGPQAAIGRALLDGALLALYQVADRNFVLVPIDTEGTPTGAAAAARTAVEERVELAIGPVFGTGVTAAAPVLLAAGINMLPLSNDSAVAEPGVYLSGLLPETQIGRVLRYASGRGSRNVAALLPDNALGTRVKSALESVAAELRMAPPRIAFFGSDTSSIVRAVRSIGDYENRRAALLAQRRSLEGSDDEVSRRTLDRLKALETFGPVPFDSLVVAASGTELTEVAAQLGNFDIDTKRVRLLGLSSWIAEGTGREPALVGAWFAAEPQGQTVEYSLQFKDIFGTDPHPLSTASFDLTALAAILAARDDRGRFGREILTDPSGFVGISGLFRFLPNGLPERGLEVREVEPWGSKTIDPAPETFVRITN